MRQYSILSLLFVVSYIAVAVALVQLVLWYMRFYDFGVLLLYPGTIGFVAIATILVSATTAMLSTRDSAGWHWLNHSWIIVSANVNYGLLSAFYVNSTEFPEHYQEGFSASVISIVPIALLLTVPVVCVLARRSINSLSNLLILVPAVIAIADTLLVWLFSSVLFGTLVGDRLLR